MANVSEIEVLLKKIENVLDEIQAQEDETAKIDKGETTEKLDKIIELLEVIIDNQNE